MDKELEKMFRDPYLMLAYNCSRICLRTTPEILRKYPCLMVMERTITMRLKDHDGRAHIYDLFSEEEVEEDHNEIMVAASNLAKQNRLLADFEYEFFDIDCEIWLPEPRLLTEPEERKLRLFVIYDRKISEEEIEGIE